jgi:hypothetical protein
MFFSTNPPREGYLHGRLAFAIKRRCLTAAAQLADDRQGQCPGLPGETAMKPFAVLILSA